MTRTLIADLRAHIGAEVCVHGWVRTIRDQKRIQFLILRDHTGLAQAVVEKSDARAPLNQV
ncbi:MAG TPA: OB-fold nucleic acid binding domain-containing protein, partial [bacterium]|nr:OB-fold nucleic acid binding domain-containing protein [bacterium]